MGVWEYGSMGVWEYGSVNKNTSTDNRQQNILWSTDN
jgi:hypothetical protein